MHEKSWDTTHYPLRNLLTDSKVCQKSCLIFYCCNHTWRHHLFYLREPVMKLTWTNKIFLNTCYPLTCLITRLLAVMLSWLKTHYKISYRAINFYFRCFVLFKFKQFSLCGVILRGKRLMSLVAPLQPSCCLGESHFF